MKKILLITILAVFPTFVFAATATSTVGGTLKVYQTLTATTQQAIVFPAQFAQTLPVPLVNIHAGMPATGIPAIMGDTQGQAGLVIVTGTGGTSFSSSIGTLSMVNAANPAIIPTLSLWGDAAYTAAVPTVITGPVGGSNQMAGVYIKGVIASGTAIVAGTYTGSVTLTVSYN